MRRNLFLTTALLGLTVVSTALGQSNLTVFAAASLNDAFTEIGKAFDAKTGNKTTFQFAGSQVLKTQLENGAKADVFASADTLQFDPLVKTGLIRNNGVFTRNRLVVITPRKSDRKVQTLGDLSSPGVKLVIANDLVPAGHYTRAMLAVLGQDTAYGKDFTSKALANVASEETNVRQVVLKVQLGEADAGVVYTTDVTPRVALAVIKIGIPAKSNQVVSYPIGMLNGSANQQAAKAFVDFVRSKDGQAILRKWGYLPTSTLRSR